jgi:hypothetical protein
VCEQEQLDSLSLYLARHGQHVSSLVVTDDNGNGPNLTLPEFATCSQLRSLSLSGPPVQLGPSSIGHQGVLRAVPQLTRLEVSSLSSIVDTDSGAVTAALAGLTGLQHLELSSFDMSVQGISIAALAQQLTHLAISLQLLGGQARRSRQIRGLPQLQELTLEHDGDDEVLGAGGLAGLRHLMKLFFHKQSSAMHGCLEPSVFADLPQLQQLVLYDVDIAGAPATLLQELERLQQLTRLSLSEVLDSDTAPAPVPAYSALTASSRLQCLALYDCTLPPGAWQHVFSAQRPELQELMVADCGRFSALDVESMVSAGPGLRRLERRDWRGSTLYAQPQQMSQLVPAAVVPLSRLSQLSGLHLSGVDDAVAGAVLAQLSGLCSLSMWSNSSRLSVAGLLALTTLHQLTSLWSHHGQERPPLSLRNKVCACVRGWGCWLAARANRLCESAVVSNCPAAACNRPPVGRRQTCGASCWSTARSRVATP